MNGGGAKPPPGSMDDMFTITGYRSKTSIRAHFPTVCGGRFNKTTVARILAGGK